VKFPARSVTEKFCKVGDDGIAAEDRLAPRFTIRRRDREVSARAQGITGPPCREEGAERFARRHRPQCAVRTIHPRMRAIAVILCAGLVATCGAARAARDAPDPCTLVTKDDAFRLLGWSLAGRERKRYAIAGATGAMCFLDSPQGKIIVTVPDRGVDFIGATPYNDSAAASLARVTSTGSAATSFSTTARLSSRASSARYPCTSFQTNVRHRTMTSRVSRRRSSAICPSAEGWRWLGWLDSNQRMEASKAPALPLGDTPPARLRAFARRNRTPSGGAIAPARIELGRDASPIGTRAGLI